MVIEDRCTLESVWGVRSKVLAEGGCKGGLCEERPELLYSGHSWYQPAPADPPQGTAESLSQDGASSGKMYFRKGERADRQKRRESRSWVDIWLLVKANLPCRH